MLVNGIGGITGREALYNVAIAIDEELGEVPLDKFSAKQARLFVLQPLVQSVRIVTVDVNLCEKGEGDAVVLSAKLFGLRLLAQT